MNKRGVKRYIWRVLYQTLESDLRSNGAAYIYGSDDAPMTEKQVQQNVAATEDALKTLARLGRIDLQEPSGPIW